MRCFSLKFLTLFFVALLFATQVVSSPVPEPKKFFKRIEKIGRNVRDGLIKAGPAIDVVKSVKTLG
ncbi:cecropin-A-like [Arctopsyche grandis]|uniref:cecropin-A-like n=1 Tax=Arctopsyche grandis TaxID=121162 RepID=UPI00406D790D